MNENFFESDVVDGVVVVSEVSGDEVEASLAEGLGSGILEPRAVRALASWAESAQSTSHGKRGIFQRDKYVTPGKIYKQMAIAYDALDDDVIGNVADLSEAMAFQKVTFETQGSKDQENIWHQIGTDIDLDGFVRQMWRELFTVSQCYPVVWWGQKTYKVTGKRKKRTARKEYNIEVPTQLGFLDPTRVVPVNADPFGNTELAWVMDSDDDHVVGVTDGLFDMFAGKYTPGKVEAAQLRKEDIDVDRLMLLNPRHVWSHTFTKSPFERWARVRMRSVFPLLDLKHQLREMDRAFLLGGINFIVLVTRGSDQQPSSANEVRDTAGQVRGQSRSPIIVTDHRINIEIITPDIEHVLNEKKWDVIDQRILMRMWGMFTMPNDTGNRETSMTMGRVIARGLASRRYMMKRSIEKHVIRPTYESAANKDQDFSEDTFLEFAPRRMELEFDPSVVTMLQSLRDRGDLSRETILTEFGFDQNLEASRREYEDKTWKTVFRPVNVPFDSPNKGNPDKSGREGGRPPGKKTEGEE